MSRARRKHSLVFRAKVALEAMRGKSRWPPGSRSTPTKFKLGRRPWPMERPPFFDHGIGTKPNSWRIAETVGYKQRGRAILQIRMRGINPRNQTDHHRHLFVHGRIFPFVPPGPLRFASLLV